MRVALGVVVVAAVTAALAGSVNAAPKLPAGDRAAIDRTLDVFVPAAIGRVHSERAWPVTTAAMHRGGTLADWRQGLLPVQPFPVIGTTFHGWTLDRAGRGRADVVLLVHLRKGNDLNLGAVSFDLTMPSGRHSVPDLLALGAGAVLVIAPRLSAKEAIAEAN